MKDKTCNSCTYYRQHYILDGKKILRIYCGHCTLTIKKSLSRHKKPYAPICEAYVPSPPDTEAFASREYLSKALLDHVLSLPLLPNIEDAKP